MIRGEYRLTLVCDAKPRCGIFAPFGAPSKMKAKAKAREAGWILRKDQKCVCPSHADAHRESGYKFISTSAGLTTHADADGGSSGQT